MEQVLQETQQVMVIANERMQRELYFYDAIAKETKHLPGKPGVLIQANVYHAWWGWCDKVAYDEITPDGRTIWRCWYVPVGNVEAVE